MKYLIAGGDERAVQLAESLRADGAEVACLALDAAPLPGSARKISAPEECGCVVLPLPAESGRLGTLNAPFAAEPVSIHALLNALPEGSLVCGGKLSERLRDTAKSRGLKCADYFTRPEFTVGNAAITAEAALYILMREFSGTLFKSRALVVGYGRIGRLLASKLNALGAYVSVLSRNPEARAMAEAAGCRAIAPGEHFDSPQMLINTAPGAVLTPEQLESLDRACLMLELASPPYGIDAAQAQRLGLRCVTAPGLPGKYAPKAAAELVKKAVGKIMEENGYA